MPPLNLDRTRIFDRVEVTEAGCWEWQGATHSYGYGQIRIANRCYRVHRIAWELANGPIPEGMFVLHECDNPPCCNPAHLHLGTNHDNAMEAKARGRLRLEPAHAVNRNKTHCAQGHPFDEANTYITKSGYRDCRACNRERGRRRYQSERG